MDAQLPVVDATAEQAVDGMRQQFLRAFGRHWIGWRLARAAWPPFREALLQGAGVMTAAAAARSAAEERNRRILLVARWTRGKVHRTVDRAVAAATNAP